MEETRTELTSAVEDYLKAIYALGSEGKRATTSALAERMHVSAPSATASCSRSAAGSARSRCSGITG